MHPGGSAGGVETVHVLGREPADQARQHIPRARRRQPRRAVRIDRHPTVRFRNDGLMALQQDDRVGPDRGPGSRVRRGQVCEVRKQARELSPVRSQHIIAVQQGEQVVLPPLEHAQRIGVDHKHRPGRGKGMQIGDGLLSQSRSRADHHGVGVPEPVAQIVGPVEGLDHHCLQGRCQHRNGCRRCHDPDQPGPDPQSRPRRQSGGSGTMGRARHHGQPPARVFVGLCPRPGQAGSPVSGLRWDGHDASVHG